MNKESLVKIVLISLLFFYGGFNVFTGYQKRYMTGIYKSVTMTDVEYMRLKCEHIRLYSEMALFLGSIYIIAAICVYVGISGWIFVLFGLQFMTLFSRCGLVAGYFSWQDLLAPLIFGSLLLYVRKNRK